MMDAKQITWRHLTVGQQIEGWRNGNSCHMAQATVKAKNAAFVTLLVFDRWEEKVSSEGTLFEVKMSMEEFRHA